MIERVQLETETDMASIAGRATLLAGTAMGLYKTGLPQFDTGYFRRSMSRVSGVGINEAKVRNPIESYFGFQGFFKDPRLLKQANPVNTKTIDLVNLKGLLPGGYKGRSTGLYNQIEGFYSDLSKMYGTGALSMEMSGAGSRSELLRIKAGRESFDIPIVSTLGEISLGERFQNRYTARSIVGEVTDKAVELEGLDVALTRKYKEELKRIKAGEISGKDIKRAITDKAIWEETRGAIDPTKIKASALSQLRKEQAIVDPFKEYTQEGLMSKMKRISGIKGYAGGSAGMFAGGVVLTPESLLSRGLPGAEASISAYQLIRQSQFEGARPTSIKWMEEAGVGQFTVATIDDMESFKRAAKKTGLSIGELAAEEAVLNNTSNIGVKNKMYTFNIDTNREQTGFTRNLMRDVYEAAEAQGMDPKAVSKAMTSAGGLEGINLDLNSKLRRLQEREGVIGKEIDALYSWRESARARGAGREELLKVNREIAGKKRGLESVREATRGFGQLGFAPRTGQPVTIPGGDMSNIIRNIKMEGGRLSIATESHFKFDIGSKLFTGGGGGKWTMKSRGDVPSILAFMEQEKLYKATGQLEDVSKLREYFKDVQMISAESPVRVKQGALAPRESMTATMSYVSNIMKTGSPEQIKKLEELGVVSGEFVGTNLDAKQIIGKIKGWHPGQSMEQIFGGEEFLGSKVSEMVMAPDISSLQAGVGRTGTVSERAAYNLQAMGLGDFLEDIMSRRKAGYSPFLQMQELQAAESIMADFTAKGSSLEKYAGDMERLFQPELAGRREFLGGKERATIALGKRVAGVEKVTVFASDVMQPFAGEGAAGELSELDRSTRDLMRSVLRGEDEAFQVAKAKRYKGAIADVEANISRSMFKGKIKGSMYGQAVSALEGMDAAALEMGKSMGIQGDMATPLIAMSRQDIQRKFGKEAAKQAAEGELWGMMTREPIEGVHSSLPVNIRTAEEFGGAPGKLEGAVYVSGERTSQDLIRKSLFVDFDKDTVNVIAAKSARAKESIMGFYGAGGKPQTAMGVEYFESLKRMASFELKGREPLDILKLTNQELIGVNAAQKGLEKGAIGTFSNEFKNIHIGLREQMKPTMGKAAAEAYYLGEDFSHLFIENILKAKHQSKEALVADSVREVSALFTDKVGTPYAAMGKGQKAQELQRVFDDLVFGNKKIADTVREADIGRVSEGFAEEMGFARELAEARAMEQHAQRATMVDDIISKATKQKDAFKKISNITNIQNVLEAHSVGRAVQKTGDYSIGIAQRNVSKMHSTAAFIKDTADATSSFMTRGLKNVGLWGILPTAAIGLAASLTTKPKVLEPAMDTGKLHERDAQYTEGLGEASAGKTLFSIPEPKYDSFQVSGIADRRTNFESLRAHSAASGRSTNIRVQDHRSHMDKYKIEEMVEKGY